MLRNDKYSNALRHKMTCISEQIDTPHDFVSGWYAIHWIIVIVLLITTTQTGDAKQNTVDLL